MPVTACSTLRFGGLDILYDERVLEPRPWTLLQSEWAGELSPGAPDGPILELCCGAGHIGLAAAGVTGRPLVQVDVSPAAAELAEANAEAAGLASDVRCGDVEHVVRPGETFPLVIADPPYLPSALVPEHPDDPVSAIDGGPDGMALVRRCLAVVERCLDPDGAALVQVHGEAQVEALRGEVPGTLELFASRTHDRHRAVVLLVRATSTVDETEPRRSD